MGIGQKYSIILPTYNERENISVCVFLLNKHLKPRCVTARVVREPSHAKNCSLCS
jgi:GT2 family glycosyltransferase